MFAAALFLCGCSRVPEQPLYFLSETVERDGVTITKTFSGPALPTAPLFVVDD